MLLSYWGGGRKSRGESLVAIELTSMTFSPYTSFDNTDVPIKLRHGGCYGKALTR
jgi:hypothetical protein